MVLNAPKTLPALLEPRTGFFAKGKALVKFYKAGVLNVWSNNKDRKSILSAYRARNSRDLVRSFVEYSHLQSIQAGLEQKDPKRAIRPSNQPEKSATETGTEIKRLTRPQLLTVLRTDRDFFKIPLFGVIFAVFFEFTPLVLAAVPRIAPSTCFSAGYRTKLSQIYTKHRTELEKHAQDESMDFALSVYRLSSPQLRALALTVLPGMSLTYKIAPQGWLRNRVQQHIMEVRADDTLLRPGDLATLDSAELDAACIARALDIEQDDRAKQAALSQWLAEFTEPADAGYFITHKRDA